MEGWEMLCDFMGVVTWVVLAIMIAVMLMVVIVFVAGILLIVFGIKRRKDPAKRTSGTVMLVFGIIIMSIYGLFIGLKLMIALFSVML